MNFALCLNGEEGIAAFCVKGNNHGKDFVPGRSSLFSGTQSNVKKRLTFPDECCALLRLGREERALRSFCLESETGANGLTSGGMLNFFEGLDNQRKAVSISAY